VTGWGFCGERDTRERIEDGLCNITWHALAILRKIDEFLGGTPVRGRDVAIDKLAVCMHALPPIVHAVHFEIRDLILAAGKVGNRF
jgi:hypothetical protein